MIIRYTFQTRDQNKIVAIISFIHDDNEDTYRISKIYEWKMVLNFISSELWRNLNRKEAELNTYKFYSTLDTIDVVLNYESTNKKKKEDIVKEGMERCFNNLCEKYNVYYNYNTKYERKVK